MLKRKISEVLMQWKTEGAKQALNIIGARQIGKSTAVREFGKSNYASFIEINFIDDPQAVSIFQNTNGAEEILVNITAYTHQEIIPHNTLILLDEIQECPEARTAIKFLVEDGRAHYVETGSLLGVRVQDIRSYPVGFERLVRMYPMDFEEFLWAVNMPVSVIDVVRECFEQRKPVADAIHIRFLKLFYLWMVVGGMPAVVDDYVHHQDIARVSKLKQTILDLYELDITKYALPSQKLKIREIFNAIPSQLDEKNRRFMFSKIDKGYRYRELETSFLWLSEAGISLPCFNTNAPVSPLRLNEKRSLFKLYLCDTGLLCEMSESPIEFALLQGNVDINLGSILENAFAQTLASKLGGKELFYFDNKTMELDFLLQHGNSVDVLEIKSGNTWTAHPSLDKALAHVDWNIDRAFVFCKGNVEKKNNITYLPFYMSMFYDPLVTPKKTDLDLHSLLDELTPEYASALQAEKDAESHNK